MKSLPTKQEQVEALLKGNAYELVRKYFPNMELNTESYSTAFNLKKEDIINYLKQNYRIADLINTVHSDKDGFYAILKKGEYEVYTQEKGIAFEDTIVYSEDHVWKLFVDYLIRTSGTGLNF